MLGQLSIRVHQPTLNDWVVGDKKCCFYSNSQCPVSPLTHFVDVTSHLNNAFCIPTASMFYSLAFSPARQCLVKLKSFEKEMELCKLLLTCFTCLERFIPIFKKTCARFWECVSGWFMSTDTILPDCLLVQVDECLDWIQIYCSVERQHRTQKQSYRHIRVITDSQLC